MLINYWC